MSTDFEALELRLMQDHLASAPPKEWLVTALTINYDGKHRLLAWMAAHPKLDTATALALYWYSQPGYFQRYADEKDVPAVNRSGWRLVRKLQQRLLDGPLMPAGAAWDPASDLSSPTGDPKLPGHDWTAEAMPAAKKPAWPIPAALLRAVPGEPFDVIAFAAAQGWDDGMPPSVLQALEAAYEAHKDDGEDDDD